MVMWSPVGKDIICMEPWTSKPFALNEKDGLCYVKAGESEKEYITINIDRR